MATHDDTPLKLCRKCQKMLPCDDDHFYRNRGNPNFLQNSKIWYERWNGIIRVDVQAVKANYW